MGRVCFPLSSTLIDSIGSGLGGNTQAAISLSQNWILLIFAFPFAVISSFIVVILVRHYAMCLFYSMTVITILALIGAGVLLIFNINFSANSTR